MTLAPGITRPHLDEFLPYFGQYIDLVPEGDLSSILESQMEETCVTLEGLSADSATLRPSPGEWSPLDIAVHVSDSERLLAFRAFVFARSDGAELPGVEFEEFAAKANANSRAIVDVVDELRAVRSSSVALFRNLTGDASMNRGIASGNEISVRALAYVIAGHELHHLVDLRRATPRHDTLDLG